MNKKALILRVFIIALLVFGTWWNASVLLAADCTECKTTDDGIQGCGVNWGEHDWCKADTWGTRCESGGTLGLCVGGCIVGEDPGCHWLIE